MRAKGRKGTTIAEMCMVLMLATIIATMVTSFSMSVSRRTQLSNARLDLVNDLDSVEALTEAWYGQMKLQNIALSVNENEITAAGYSLSFRDGVLIGTLPGGESITYQTTCIKEISFSCVERTDSATDTLLFYTLKYDEPGLPEDETERIFCVNPRVGSTYAIGGGAEHETE